MDVAEVAASLREARRKRPVPQIGYTVPQERLDRIRSAVASKWIDSVAGSKGRIARTHSAPHRPQTSPLRSTAHTGPLMKVKYVNSETGANPGSGGILGRRESACDGCPKSWAHGNPYSKPFPRSRLWSPRDLSGLSGERQPDGWDTRAEEEEAALAQKQNKVSAKELYARLAAAGPPCAGRPFADGKIKNEFISKDAAGDNAEDTERGQCEAPDDVARAHESRKKRTRYLDATDSAGNHVPTDALCNKSYSSNGPPADQERETDRSQSNHYSPDVTAATSSEPQKFAAQKQRHCTPFVTQTPSPCTGARESCPQPMAPVHGIIYSTCETEQIITATSTHDALRVSVERVDHDKVSGMATAFTTPTDETALALKCEQSIKSSSTSSSGSSPSSRSDSSDSNFYSDDSAGIMEDFTSGVDAWLEDVAGVGRQEFFELFKHDVTPQFSRPAPSILGRNGIGSNFVDGEPNIKYMPQRPVRLRVTQPASPETLTSPRAVQSRSTLVKHASPRLLPSSLLSPQLARENPVNKNSQGHPQSSTNGVESRQDKTPESNGGNGVGAVDKSHQSLQTPSPPDTQFASQERRQSSTTIRSVGISQHVGAGKHRKITSPPACSSLPAGRERIAENQEKKGSKDHDDVFPWPHTSDGRTIEIASLKAPFLGDMIDPAMIAHSKMKRPSSPRRDYLMSCAERQLMPVPVIMSALKVKSRAASALPMTANSREGNENEIIHTATGGIEQSITKKAKNTNGIEHAVGDEAKKGEVLNGSISLRHYYVGAARAKCLESVVTSVPVVLTQVELLNSGLDEMASETLLDVLAGRASSITRLNLSRNRIGTRGALALARLIGQKGCAMQCLKLDGNKAGDKAIMIILKALQKHHPPLADLGISDNCITVRTMQECAGPLLTGGLCLQNLDFGWNHLNQQAMEELADALKWNESVTKMNLEFNNAGEGIHALAEALQAHKSIAAIDLTANQVRWQGAIALSAAVEINPALRNVKLRDNPIGTAAGIQLAVALARRRLRKKERQARAKGQSKQEDSESKTKKPGGNKSAAVSDARAPAPPQRPDVDDHLYWLDVKTDRTWDIRLDRPFDRVIATEVLMAFNFSVGGSLTGLLKTVGQAPSPVLFKRREKLVDEPGLSAGRVNGTFTDRRTTKIPELCVQVGGLLARGGVLGGAEGKAVKGGRGKPGGAAAFNHPLAAWYNDWIERRNRGWDGDAPAVGGLPLTQEFQRLLRQLPTRGLLKLAYKAGKPISTRLSLVVGTNQHGQPCTKESASPQAKAANIGRRSDDLVNGKSGVPTSKDAGGGGSMASSALGATKGDASNVPAAGCDEDDCLADQEVGSGFQSLLLLMESLGSATRMSQMAECLARRFWLTDSQVRAVLNAFSHEPKMSEPRCRAFLALLPNIRHNSLRTMASKLSPRIKRLQGIPLPDPTQLAKEVEAREKAELAAGGAIAARARTARAARLSEAATQRQAGGRRGVQRIGGDDAQTQEMVERFRDCGWQEGACFADLDLGVLSGVSACTFRRFGMEKLLTEAEHRKLGIAVESSAYFNPFVPTGHYTIDMTKAGDRDTFRAILSLDKVNRAYVGMSKGLCDPSQHGNGHLLRNFRLGGSSRAVKFGILSRRARAKINKKAKKKAKKKVQKEASKDTKKPKDVAQSSIGNDNITSSKGQKVERDQRGNQTEKDVGDRPDKSSGQTKRGHRSVSKGETSKKASTSTGGKPNANKVALAGRDSGTTTNTTTAGKCYPTIPAASTVSFDFLHYIRPPPEAQRTPDDTFQELLSLLKTCGTPQMDEGTTCKGMGWGEATGCDWRTRELMRVNTLRNLCHVLHFDCQQVTELLQLFPGEGETSPGRRQEGRKGVELSPELWGGSSSREEAFIAVFSRITDESRLDLCLGLLTVREVSRCEARLGRLSLFMPTQPDGDYKLDLRDFENRQVVTLFLELEQRDPTVQLLGTRHDGKFLEEGSASWQDGVPKRGQFRTRVVTRRAFKTVQQLAASDAVRWKMARDNLGWHERPPTTKTRTTSFKTAKTSPTSKNKFATPHGETRFAADRGTEDTRPRKRAIVRKAKKQKDRRKDSLGGDSVAATRVRRHHSFAYLPRSQFSGLTDGVSCLDAEGGKAPLQNAHAVAQVESGLEIDSPAGMDGKQSDPTTDTGHKSQGRRASNETADSTKADFSRSKTTKPSRDGDSSRDGTNVRNCEQGLSAEKGLEAKGNDGGEEKISGQVVGVVEPKRPMVRRWPSSADLGMASDGR